MRSLLLVLSALCAITAKAQDPIAIHGYVYCEDKLFLNQDAWGFKSFDVRVDKNVLKVNAEFKYVNCSKVGTDYKPLDTYFQIPEGDKDYYDADKRKALIFLELDKDKTDEDRIFLTQITTTETNGVQTHLVKEDVKLKTVLGDDYKSYIAGNEVTKDFIIGLGHPQVSSPDDNFNPKIDNFGVSLGLMRVILKFKQGTVSIDALARTL